jgi:hypothetical protein
MPQPHLAVHQQCLPQQLLLFACHQLQGLLMCLLLCCVAQAKLVERATANVAGSSRQLLDEGVLQFKVANAMAGAA